MLTCSLKNNHNASMLGTRVIGLHYSRSSLIRTPLLRNLANPKCRHKLKMILIIDFEFEGHVKRMRIPYSSCKLLILFMRKLTKAYKVNRIAINYCQISLELAYPYLREGSRYFTNPNFSLIRKASGPKLFGLARVYCI